LDLVDELGEIQTRLAPLKKRETELVREIRGWAEAEHKPGQEAVYEGRHYLAPVTAKPSRRIISLASRLILLAKLGKQKFCELCGFTVETAEKELDPALFNQLVEEEKNCGTRSVKTILRVKSKAA
jgi:hypothetical protein